MINGRERICVQGITGKYGRLHTEKMLNYGTNIVCGVSKNNIIKKLHRVEVLSNMYDAVNKFRVDTSVVFVPAPYAKNAVFEAINAGVKKIIIITEHIPQQDMLDIYKISKDNDVRIIGPNCPGVIFPGISKIGIMPERAFKPGDIAVISKSGTLMYEISNYLSKYSTGIKIGIGLGGDPIIGTSVAEAMEYIMNENIKKVVVIGEIGGNDEVNGIEYALKKGYNGDIKVFFAGRTAPKGKRMGHAGAILDGYEGSIEYKEKKLKKLGVKVIKNIPELI
ncbi:succinyl-CoA synthetase alpha subunit [Marinitoga hydrogenitolerans DSM 16785]|uniref:Succinyl-CoA synthetase alpha subunit n=1 Tax=Marinitoga hydrogenitolerans (strain DSM 16785 / JCM 12826 / AT1271) TaxID=1122195 RepID=A0A1M4Y7V7_MARH1|nr:CoA-binding protein [Marinitoga hydrogenitolerans]SHF01522.1 succinyl-CoA synthetase alpha subunit [Marinitoga hydrogenitolerans DSM 16785]